jgi:hypothetical protein
MGYNSEIFYNFYFLLEYLNILRIKPSQNNFKENFSLHIEKIALKETVKQA